MTDDRISRIDTLWTLVRQAHGQVTLDARSAQQQLLDRYGGAAKRYLLAALRNEHAADEVFQEFALRFVRGDFHRAAPERGRFRSFLKTVLYHLVCDHQKGRKRSPAQLGALEAVEPVSPSEADALDEQFTKSWRDDLLARTWVALEEEQRQSGKPHHTVLRFRSQHPDLRSPELAEQLSERLQKPISAANVRVLLHRSRERFADLLLEEIGQSLDNPTIDDLEQEVADLRLMDYCRPAIDRRRENSAI
jgi:RNA polymerase sigma-70 factor (ECF subfamily)